MEKVSINICSQGRESLLLALKLMALDNQQVVGYRVDDSKDQLLLYWAETKVSGYCPFPAPMAADELLAGIIEGWLNGALYPPEPDHDGSNEKGFQFLSNDWAEVGEWQLAVAVRPHWVEYHK